MHSLAADFPSRLKAVAAARWSLLFMCFFLELAMFDKLVKPLEFQLVIRDSTRNRRQGKQ